MRILRTSCSGTSLVELASAVAAAFFVLLAVGTVVATGSRLSTQALKNTRLKRDADAALQLMETMAREREASAIQVSEAGDELTLDPDTADSCTFCVQDGDLLQVTADSSGVVVDDEVTACSFEWVDDPSYEAPLLRIHLELSNGDSEVCTTTLVKPRN